MKWLSMKTWNTRNYSRVLNFFWLETGQVHIFIIAHFRKINNTCKTSIINILENKLWPCHLHSLNIDFLSGVVSRKVDKYKGNKILQNITYLCMHLSQIWTLLFKEVIFFPFLMDFSLSKLYFWKWLDDLPWLECLACLKK